MQLTPLLASLVSDLEDFDGTSMPATSPLSIAVTSVLSASGDIFSDGGDVVAGSIAPVVPDMEGHAGARAQQGVRLLSGLHEFEAMLDAYPAFKAEPATVAMPPPPPPTEVTAKTAVAAIAAGGDSHPVVDPNADPRAELARLFPKAILRSEKDVYRAYKNRVRGLTTEMVAELAKLRRREKQCVYAGVQRRRRIATAHAMESELEKLAAENDRLRAENAKLNAELNAVNAASQLGR